jgi:hypothetical protein
MAPFSLFAVFLSLLLVIWTWPDAKPGIIPIVLILLVSLGGLASCSMNKMIRRETEELRTSAYQKDPQIITESQLANLPAPVQKWLRTTHIIGKPEIFNAHVKQQALLKMKPEQKEWHKAEAVQLTTADAPAFVWSLEMNMSPFVKIKGRDKYNDGRGEMLIKLYSLFPIVNEKGPKMDEGTLQRYLGELVWLPSLALSPYITWEAVDEYAANATMSYQGVTGSGTFYFNENGDFERFVALRYMGNEKDARKYPWEITVDEYGVFEGIRVPSRMKATWHLDDGEWTWLKLVIADIRYNI